MFQKVFEYAGTHKKGLYVSTAVVLISVLMGAPFCAVLLVIAPLIIGEAIDTSFIIFASYVGIGMPDTTSYSLWLGAEYFTQGRFRLRTTLQKEFEKLPLGVIQDKGTGTVKKTVY